MNNQITIFDVNIKTEYPNVVDCIFACNGKKLGSWLSGAYVLNDEYLAWFIHISKDGKTQIEQDWLNIEDGEFIYENCTMIPAKKIDKDTKTHKKVLFASYGSSGPYIFKGVYKLIEKESMDMLRKYKRIATSINISELQ